MTDGLANVLGLLTRTAPAYKHRFASLSSVGFSTNGDLGEGRFVFWTYRQRKARARYRDRTVFAPVVFDSPAAAHEAAIVRGFLPEPSPVREDVSRSFEAFVSYGSLGVEEILRAESRYREALVRFGFPSERVERVLWSGIDHGGDLAVPEELGRRVREMWSRLGQTRRSEILPGIPNRLPYRYRNSSFRVDPVHRALAFLVEGGKKLGEPVGWAEEMFRLYGDGYVLRLPFETFRAAIAYPVFRPELGDNPVPLRATPPND